MSDGTWRGAWFKFDLQSITITMTQTLYLPFRLIDLDLKIYPISFETPCAMVPFRV